MFSQAFMSTFKVSEKLITDEFQSCHVVSQKELAHRRYDVESVHVNEIALAGQVHNIRIEWMNGEVRDREKVMRGLKTVDTPILKGYQIYHNFVRPDESLKGRTPADLAGIKVQGENKWLTLIQNASKGEA